MLLLELDTNTVLFSGLNRKPERSAKCCRMPRIFPTEIASALQNIKMSSAKVRCVKFSLQHFQCNLKVLSSAAARKDADKASMTSVNNRGESGSPWRRPLVPGKKPTISPFIWIENLAEVTHSIMLWIMDDGKPND